MFTTRTSIGPARLAPADWKGFSSEADAQLAKIKQTHDALRSLLASDELKGTAFHRTFAFPPQPDLVLR